MNQTQLLESENKSMYYSCTKHIIVFWIRRPLSPEDGYHHIKGTYSPHPHETVVDFYNEDGGRMFLGNTYYPLT
jgi:hypothetical protein